MHIDNYTLVYFIGMLFICKCNFIRQFGNLPMNSIEEVYTDTSEESLIKYLKRPLNFAFPAVQSSQFDKNPFQRTSGPKQKAKSVSAINLSQKAIQIAHVNSKHKSCVITKKYKVRGNLEKLPKPACITSEADEPEEILNGELNKLKKSMSNNSIPKNETISQETIMSKAEGVYKMQLTGEVVYNFRELQLIKVPGREEIGRRKILLPKPTKLKKSNKTLFLDLDETLVHTMQANLDYSLVPIDPQAVRTTTFLLSATNKLLNLKIVFRPHVREFLKELSAMYEIVVYKTITIGIHSRKQSLRRDHNQLDRSCEGIHRLQIIQGRLHPKRECANKRSKNIFK
eukprot:TRINITY_DN2234_c0_g1_i1.p1 TRINITY_DN2234_c0_g1~~TRINITY_DN2234_c0_g1_i1.p1  ORF type:complete len:342 (-),score=25.07 TRINITY_DN2234_c0_g1_i1:432-1457(-)